MVQECYYVSFLRNFDMWQKPLKWLRWPNNKRDKQVCLNNQWCWALFHSCYSIPNPGAPIIIFKKDSSNFEYSWLTIQFEKQIDGAHVLTLISLVLLWSNCINPLSIFIGKAGLPVKACSKCDMVKATSISTGISLSQLIHGVLRLPPEIH